MPQDTIKVETIRWGKAPTVESARYYASRDFLFIYLCLDSGNPNLNKWPEVSPQGFRKEEEPAHWCLFLHPVYLSGRHGRGISEVKIIPQGLDQFRGSERIFVQQDSYVIFLVILANEFEREMSELLRPAEVVIQWRERLEC